jgi:predicted DNA-binding transcriptional regulator YafY
MANTSSRMLRLLSLLQTHRFWPGAELAERLNISVRTVRRDVDRLRELGYPVDAHRGLEGGYQLAAGAALPPLVLDDDEAVALTIGLRIAAQGAVAGIEDSSVRALAKVSQIMPPQLRRRVDALRSATVPAVWSTSGDTPIVDAGMLATVAQACRDEERLRFNYTASTGDKSSRNVEPHRLVSLGRRWYLVAYDVRREDWRTFRLDRLDGVRTTGMRFQARQLPAPDAATFVRNAIGTVRPEYTVEALVHMPAQAVRNQIGRWATVHELDGERCRIRMVADQLDWPTFALGSLRAEFEIIGPPEMVEHIRDWAARFARAGVP